MVTFWVTILALSILLYVLLDGFDLGVGMLFGLIGGDTERRTMMSAVAPVWDSNETWLVVTAVVLWGDFPVVYSILLSAFYLPLFLMLARLILRGVAFEYRLKTQRLRWIWDVAFAGGSLVAAFMQGLTVGALVEGLPVAGTLYTGGAFGWLSPFTLLCGVGLCIGYALLGACWLVKKCEGDVRESAYRLIPPLSIGLPILDRLTDALDKALDDENVRRRLAEIGCDVPEKARRGQASLGVLVKNEMARWTSIIKVANVKLE
jgi:cytochrome bd ubiquinol oxidase subunit II